MSWQTPLAWLGLAAIAVPILVHLLTRQQAVRVAFPTLRFLSALPAVQVRRHRLTDGLLLVVRIAILTAAVAALAGPLIERRAPPAAGADGMARAIVVDTSASVDADAARRAAAQLSAESRGAPAIESERVPDGIRAALAALGAAAGAPELAIVSDFQTGAVSAEDFRSVPGGVGIRLVRVAQRAQQAIAAPAIRTTGRTISTSVEAATAGTNVVWTSTASANRAAGLTVVAAESDRASVDAAIEAAIGTGVPADAPPRQLTIILPGAPEREARMSAARAIDRQWMFEMADRIARDRTLASAATALAVPSSILARRGAGSQEVLELYLSESDRVYVAALIAAAMRAQSASPVDAMAEQEPRTLSQAELSAWERPADARAHRAVPREGESDGRWLWAAALALVGVETYLRRSP